MSTIAPHIEQFAAEFADELYPRATMPSSNSEAFHMAAVAIQKWVIHTEQKKLATQPAFRSRFSKPRPKPNTPVLWRDCRGGMAIATLEQRESAGSARHPFVLMDEWTPLPCDLTAGVL